MSSWQSSQSGSNLRIQKVLHDSAFKEIQAALDFEEKKDFSAAETCYKKGQGLLLQCLSLDYTFEEKNESGKVGILREIMKYHQSRAGFFLIKQLLTFLEIF
eukprot:Sdes_comp20035_c0_seq2m12835